MTISILGCGWLGFPLAQHIHHVGFNIKGSTTTDAKLHTLKENGICPFKISISEDLVESNSALFWESDLLFLNIPPGRRQPNVVESFQKKVSAVRDILESSDSSINRVLFASSTSVYPKESGYFKEEDAKSGNASRPSGEALLLTEKLLQDSNVFETVILRFGGLYGYSRHPVKNLSGRINISAPLEPVNLIHQDDCIRIIETIIKNDNVSGVYNAVSDGHPPRKTMYQSAAKHYGIEPPHFDDKSESTDRVISNEKLKKDLNFSFIYPNPMDHTA